MKKNGPLDWLKKIIGANKSGAPPKKQGRMYYVLILLLVGAALMLINDFWKVDQEKKSTSVSKEETADDEAEVFGHKKNKNTRTPEMQAFEERYESQLKEALEQIVGVHNVTVVVNVEATEQNVFEKNTVLKNQTTKEEDKEGGSRILEDQSTEDQLVLIREGDKDVPVISETRKPEIKGVLVVAGGADQMQVKKWIVEAVTRMLDVPSHKVAVMPKKSKGDS